MAIDIKTLHIGAHVLVNGKRERVRGLDEDNGLIVRFPAEYVLASDVEPIAITLDGLTELGFVDLSNEFVSGMKYCKTISKKEISFAPMNDGFWEIGVLMGGFDIGTCLCRYLHEGEAFLALYNVELIND